jgi:hypothetical protein
MAVRERHVCEVHAGWGGDVRVNEAANWGGLIAISKAAISRSDDGPSSNGGPYADDSEGTG